MVTKALALFPGQGSQYPGMAVDLIEASSSVRRFAAEASDIVGFDMEGTLRTASEEDIKATRLAQPLVAFASLAALMTLEERGFEAAAAAGHSLGEIPAMAAAGVLDRATALDLAARRGEAMDVACRRLAEAGGTAMAAVLGLGIEAIEEAIAGIEGVWAANMNAPDQTVISGSLEGVTRAEAALRDKGARRVIALKVSGPFHTPLMEEAQAAFQPALERVAFSDPAIPLVSSMSGDVVRSGREARALLAGQITAPVLWVETQRRARDFDVEAVLEAGPGRNLAGLWKSSGSSLPCRQAGTAESIEAALRELRGEVA